MKKIRRNGILCHPTSFSSKFGIGDFGPEAYNILKKFSENGIDLWQILPLGPTGYGNSPYATRSSFAGNENLISLELLEKDGYIDLKNIEIPDFSKNRIDFLLVENWKRPLLVEAAENFLSKGLSEEYYNFTKSNFWLENYCLFMSIYEEYHDSRWYSVWDPSLRDRNPEKLAEIKKEKAHQIKIISILQFFFYKQWFALKEYANNLGIDIIGDIPIFVAGDSVDTWCNKQLFKMDEEGTFIAVSGCPPDSFSDDGQLWGNPVYDWEANKSENYNWWLKRIEQQMKFCDILRIDHFRGFSAYWEVPYGEKTARNGKWVSGPGQDLFDAIDEKFGKLPIIAEDLGFMNEDVAYLRDRNNFPGMRIALFSYDLDDDGKIDKSNVDLPENYIENCVAYPGTHDNELIQGWFNNLDSFRQNVILNYLNTNKNEVYKSIIKQVWESKANYAICSLQDVLGLDNSARMNTPSTCGPMNWSWRLDSEIDFHLNFIKELNLKYNR